jgi:uncharacterized protein YjbI with pentapeptide repeats
MTDESVPSDAPAPAIPPALPDKAQLEHEQVYLDVQKAKVELRKLEQEAKPEPWWLSLAKNVVAIGGILTVAATAYGIWDSYNKTIVDRERTRAADQRTRFEDAIKRLESTSTISKLVGISVLSGYLTTDSSSPDGRAVHRQILFTLAGLMATEHDYQIQVAVTDLISAVPPNGPIDKADWVYFQEMLISQNRALVGKGNLFSRRQMRRGAVLSDDEKAARTVGNLIAIVGRKGGIPTDLKFRDIYCVECDFHGITFPPGIDFTGAVLDRANFSGTIMKEAIFDNAELLGTTFVEAQLPGARFRSLETKAPTSDDPKRTNSLLGRTVYLDHAAEQLREYARISIPMPNFSCANLENANFDGHALFPGVLSFRRHYSTKDATKPPWYGTIPSFFLDRLERSPEIDFSPVSVVPPKFLKANLKNAKLGEARYFILIPRTDRSEVTEYMSSYQTVGDAEVKLAIGQVSEEAFQHAADPQEQPKSKKGPEEAKLERRQRRDVENFQRRLRASFYQATLDGTVLPLGMEGLFKEQIAGKDDYAEVFLPFGATSDPDLECMKKHQ